jgi:hypothetical protein
MTRHPAVFLGLEANPDYHQPVIRFRRPNGRPMTILLPEGETISVPVGDEVEFSYAKRIWTTISHNGQVVVRNPKAIA